MDRALQQGGDVTVVTTAAALQEVVAAGTPHIEIQAHIDLTTVEVVELTFLLLGEIPDSVKSIRVRSRALHALLKLVSYSSPRLGGTNSLGVYKYAACMHSTLFSPLASSPLPHSPSLAARTV